MTIFWTAVISAVGTTLVALIVEFLRGYFKLRKNRNREIKNLQQDYRRLRDTLNEFQAEIYKIELWNAYNLYENDPNQKIEPRDFARIEHLYNLYTKLGKNGSTQYEFEEIKRKYENQIKVNENHFLYDKKAAYPTSDGENNGEKPKKESDTNG